MGITRERELLEGLRDQADVVIDSTDLSIWDLRRAVAESLMSGSPRTRLEVVFVSFGFKHGVPRDVDLQFDVRFLKNPFYEPELAALTGRDQPVIDFLEGVEGMAPFLERLEALLDFLLPGLRRGGQAPSRRGVRLHGRQAPQRPHRRAHGEPLSRRSVRRDR